MCTEVTHTGREERFSTTVAQNEGQDSYQKDIPVTQGNGASGFQYNFQESRGDSQSKLL